MASYIVTDVIRVNIIHSFAVPPRVKCEQYDGDYTKLIQAIVYNGDVLYSIPSAVRRIVVSGLKPDGNGFSYDCTWSGNTVSFSLMRQMTAVNGDVPCNITMFDSENNQVSSAVFVLAVEKAALPSDVVVSSNDFQTFVDYVQAANLYWQYSKSYAVGNTGIRSGENTDNSQYYAHLARMYNGAPRNAATASAMTDVTKIYVYVGSESGYNKGHWYYYNDSAWVDGGVYNAQGQQTDTELITPGIAADAETTGIRLNKKVTYYNTVALMIADAENIKVGDTIETLGYYSINDGGGAKYKVVASSDKWCVVNIASGKVAENISDRWTAEQFGIHHDGTTDDTTLLRTILNSYNDYGKPLYFGSGDVVVSETVVFSNPIKIIGNGTRFVAPSNTVALRTRDSNFIYIDGFSFNTWADLIYVNDPKNNMSREIYLANIFFENASGEPINQGMFLQSKRPSSYDNNSGGAYSRYPLEIQNFSGYNALMITNENVSRDDDTTIVGAADNSAIGVLDRVKDVAAPTILVDGVRDFLQFINNEATYKSSSFIGCVFDIAPDGHIAIGCSHLNADNEFPGVADIKIRDNAPSIAFKSATSGNTFRLALDSDANGTVRLYMSDSSNNYYYPLILTRTNVETKRLSVKGSGDNGGIAIYNTSDASKFKNIYIDSNRHLRCSNYLSMSTDDDGLAIQTTLHGTSTNRPSLTGHSGNIGFQYFDTTLNKPIWWNGSKWVDANGSNV